MSRRSLPGQAPKLRRASNLCGDSEFRGGRPPYRCLGGHLSCLIGGQTVNEHRHWQPAPYGLSRGEIEPRLDYAIRAMSCKSTHSGQPKGAL